jgi:hypothetical protein
LTEVAEYQKLHCPKSSPGMDARDDRLMVRDDAACRKTSTTTRVLSKS